MDRGKNERVLRTNGGDEGGVEGVLGEPEEHARLPHAGVADQQKLEQVVVRLGHGEDRGEGAGHKKSKEVGGTPKGPGRKWARPPA